MYRGWTQTDYQNKHYNINQKWLQHVQRMDTNRLPKQALQYKLKGRRNIGRPRKRWRHQLHLEDQGTGNTPNPSGTWWWWWWWSTYYILCISWIIKCLIIIDGWCKHEEGLCYVVHTLLVCLLLGKLNFITLQASLKYQNVYPHINLY